MKNIAKPEKAETHYKTIVFQAAVITVLFHMALLYSFRYSPPAKAVPATKSQQIIMWNTAGAHPQSKAFNNWLEYHDPTLISRPGKAYGYGAGLRDFEVRRSIKDMPKTEEQSETVNFKEFNNLPEGQRLETDISERFVYYRTFGIAPGTQQEIAAPQLKYPVVKTDSGVLLKDVFADESVIRKAAAVKLTNPTRLNVIYQGKDFMPRITVAESCGSAGLDTFAVRKFMLDQRILDGLKLKKGDTTRLNIYWKEVEQ